MESKSEGNSRSSTPSTNSDIFSGTLRSKLIKFARKVRPDRSYADHEDAVHDVLIKIHEHVSANPSAVLPTNLESYGFRSVLNRLNDYYRKYGKEVGFEDQADQELVGKESFHEFEEQIRRTQLFNLLILAIKDEDVNPVESEVADKFLQLQMQIKNRLTNKQLIVMRMRGVDAMTLKECADRLGVSIGSVHGWYNNALGNCRKIASEIGLDMGELL